VCRGEGVGVEIMVYMPIAMRGIAQQKTAVSDLIMGLPGSPPHPPLGGDLSPRGEVEV